MIIRQYLSQKMCDLYKSDQKFTVIFNRNFSGTNHKI